MKNCGTITTTHSSRVVVVVVGVASLSLPRSTSAGNLQPATASGQARETRGWAEPNNKRFRISDAQKEFDRGRTTTRAWQRRRRLRVYPGRRKICLIREYYTFSFLGSVCSQLSYSSDAKHLGRPCRGHTAQCVSRLERIQLASPWGDAGGGGGDLFIQTGQGERSVFLGISSKFVLLVFFLCCCADSTADWHFRDIYLEFNESF